MASRLHVFANENRNFVLQDGGPITLQLYRHPWSYLDDPPPVTDWAQYGVNVQASDLLSEVTLNSTTNNQEIIFEGIPDGEGDFVLVTEFGFTDGGAVAAHGRHSVELKWGLQGGLTAYLELADTTELVLDQFDTNICAIARTFATGAPQFTGPADFTFRANAGIEFGHFHNTIPEGYSYDMGLLHFDAPPPPEPDVHGKLGDQELYAGTPEHVIIGPSGSAAYPVVSEWRAREQANGGWMAMTGRIAGELVIENPDVFVQDADWVVYIRETNEVLFSGKLKQPPPSRGAIDISAEGPGTLAEKEVDRLLYRSDGPALWTSEADELYQQRPTRPPRTGAVTTGQANGMSGGTYAWAVTHETADGETGLGPAVELALDALGPIKYHVALRIPRGPDGVTARRVYRLDPVAANYKLLATINDNTTEDYTDSTNDGALGANAPTQKEAAEIQVQVNKGAIVLHVADDGYVADDQRAGAVFSAPSATISRFTAVAHPNRALPNWELRALSSDGAKGDLTLEETYQMDDETSIVIDVDVTTGQDTVRARLRRDSSGQDNEPVDIRLTDLRVYGAVEDDDVTESDIVTDIFARLGVNEILVEETGTPVLPQDFLLTTYAEPLDLMALLSGWRWLIQRHGRNLSGDFRRYSTDVWFLMEDDAVVELYPEPQYSRVKVPYRFVNGVATEYAEATADPNLLDRIVTAPPLEIERPGSEETAQKLAQALADFLVQPRWSGEVTYYRVRNPRGVIVPAAYTGAGQQLYVPSVGAALNIDEMERGDATVTARFAPGIPLLERFNERRRSGAAV